MREELQGLKSALSSMHSQQTGLKQSFVTIEASTTTLQTFLQVDTSPYSPAPRSNIQLLVEALMEAKEDEVAKMDTSVHQCNSVLRNVRHSTEIRNIGAGTAGADILAMSRVLDTTVWAPLKARLWRWTMPAAARKATKVSHTSFKVDRLSLSWRFEFCELMSLYFRPRSVFLTPITYCCNSPMYYLATWCLLFIYLL